MTERSQQAKDAAKFLTRLIGPCDDATISDHAWRKCRRCLVWNQLEQRDPLAVRLMTAAISALLAGAAALEQQEKNDHARCVEPQLRAGESDPRADHRGRSERCQHCDGHGAIFDTDDMERNCPECVDGLAQTEGTP